MNAKIIAHALLICATYINKYGVFNSRLVLRYLIKHFILEKGWNGWQMMRKLGQKRIKSKLNDFIKTLTNWLNRPSSLYSSRPYFARTPETLELFNEAIDQ